MSNDPNLWYPQPVERANADTAAAHFVRALLFFAEPTMAGSGVQEAVVEESQIAAGEAASALDDVNGVAREELFERISDEVERDAPKRVEDALRTVLLLWPEVSATKREARAKAEAECRELREALAKGLAMMAEERGQ
jgi:hypothetical protein